MSLHLAVRVAFEAPAPKAPVEACRTRLICACGKDGFDCPPATLIVNSPSVPAQETLPAEAVAGVVVVQEPTQLTVAVASIVTELPMLSERIRAGDVSGAELEAALETSANSSSPTKDAKHTTEIRA